MQARQLRLILLGSVHTYKHRVVPPHSELYQQERDLQSVMSIQSSEHFTKCSVQIEDARSSHYLSLSTSLIHYSQVTWSRYCHSRNLIQAQIYLSM